MSKEIEAQLNTRSGGVCELCGSTNELMMYKVPPVTYTVVDKCVHVCKVCLKQLENSDMIDPNHWRCLNESMWSEVPAVQVLAWRMLNQLRGEGWPTDLLEMIYLDDETASWAREISADDEIKHLDSNGNILLKGDSVVLIKNLDVKGANLIAKRGTSVQRITLVEENPEQIEGKVNGQQIVILTKYVKKS